MAWQQRGMDVERAVVGGSEQTGRNDLAVVGKDEQLRAEREHGRDRLRSTKAGRLEERPAALPRDGGDRHFAPAVSSARGPVRRADDADELDGGMPGDGLEDREGEGAGTEEDRAGGAIGRHQCSRLAAARCARQAEWRAPRREPPLPPRRAAGPG